jgi:hypothetical protein
MKHPKISSLKKKADAVFSEFIRKRYADGEGKVTCCTCGTTKHWTEMDSGHFIGRSCNMLRYHPMNAHAQCRSCNRGGRRVMPYIKFMFERYGKKFVNTFLALEQQRHTWTEEELRKIIEEYTNE